MSSDVNKDQVYKKVVEIIGEVLDIQSDDPKMAPESRFIEDLGAESLDMAQFVMSLEDEFDKSIEDEELMGLKSVQDAVDFIYTKLAGSDE